MNNQEDDMIGVLLLGVMVTAVMGLAMLAGIAFRVSVVYGIFVSIFPIGVGVVCWCFIKWEIEDRRRR